MTTRLLASQVIIDLFVTRRLSALGDSANDALVFDVVGVVGLNVGGQTVESALDGFLRGRVHHAGLQMISLSKET